MNKISILDMPEDLLDKDQSKRASTPEKPRSENWTGKANSSKTPLNRDDFIADVAKVLAISQRELRDWVEEAALPEDVLKAILRIAKRLKLNPLMGHLDWELNSEGNYELFITIDGWITLIRRQPTFQGITFNQSSESENSTLIWMECTIYRSDLTHPITIREYCVELKTDIPCGNRCLGVCWRHKTLEQCARLAFGICGEIQAKWGKQANHNPITERVSSKTNENRKEILKKKLAHNIG